MLQAFDQQQQDLVNAASKAISYRQDIIEENILLSHALQVLFLTSFWFVKFLFSMRHWGHFFSPVPINYSYC